MYYQPAPNLFNHLDVIDVMCEEALGGRACRNLIPTSSVAITWVVNLAIFVPFSISRPFVVREGWAQRSTATNNTGNIDIGVYTPTGTRLVSVGGVASGAASSIITYGMTDTTIDVGDYFMALSCDNATAAILGGWVTVANVAAAYGIGQQTTAYVLPASATIVPVVTANQLLPQFGLNGYTVAA